MRVSLNIYLAAIIDYIAIIPPHTSYAHLGKPERGIFSVLAYMKILLTHEVNKNKL